MSKKKENHTKALVRNTLRPLPKVTVVTATRPKRQEPVVPKPREAPISGPNFDVPEINSTAIRISKQIDQVMNAKVVPAKKKSALSLDGEATKQMNFATDKSVYKNLIPLNVVTKPQPVYVPRDPLPRKDQEPNLSQFLKPKERREFIHRSSTARGFVHNTKTLDVNNLKVYKILQLNK